MTVANTANSSIFVKSDFPSFFLSEGATLVRFIEYYYEWLEQYENPVYVARKLHEYKDVDLVPSKFYQFLRDEFMKNVPMNNQIDETILLKHIKDFYLSKGSRKSYELLFRILYNEDIEIYTPGDDIMRVDDGRWIQEKSLTIVPSVSVNTITATTYVRGSISRATASFENVIVFLNTGIEYAEIYIDNLSSGNTFLQNENLLDDDNIVLGKITSNSVFTYDGRWLGDYGLVDSNMRLQDDYYYQEFSYEIQSSKSLEDYETTVRNLIHPVGTKMFGAVKYTVPIDLTFDNDTFYVEQDSLLFESYMDNIIPDFITNIGYGDGSLDAQLIFTILLDSYFTTNTSLYTIHNVTTTIGDIKNAGDLSLAPGDSPNVADLLSVSLYTLNQDKVLFDYSTDLSANVDNGDVMYINDVGNGVTNNYFVQNVVSSNVITLLNSYETTEIDNASYRYYAIP